EIGEAMRPVMRRSKYNVNCPIRDLRRAKAQSAAQARCGRSYRHASPPQANAQIARWFICGGQVLPVGRAGPRQMVSRDLFAGAQSARWVKLGGAPAGS